MDEDAARLAESLVDELVGAFGLPKTRFNHHLVWRFSRKLTERMAQGGVTFDRLVAESGLPEASRWLLTLFCNDIATRGTEHIPPSGPLLVVSNHPGAYDALVLFSQVGRKDLNWIGSQVPFLDNLPNLRKHIYFASRKDAFNRMTVMRHAVRHLRAGGALMYFAAGHRDPDPAVYPGAANLMDAWIPGADFFLKHVPGLQILPTVISGVVSQKWARHPVTSLRGKQIDRHRLAEFGQVITQLLRPGRLYVSPFISFGPMVGEADLRQEETGDNLLPALIAREKALLAEHCQAFGGYVNQDETGFAYGPRDYQIE